jgi:hypothetical protein
MVQVKRINKLKVGIIPEEKVCKELTEENAQLFYTAEKFSQPVYDLFMSRFEEAVKKEAGLDKESLEEKTERKVKRGDITFTVKATPSKSTSYQNICSRLETYLADLIHAKEQGIQREGVRTFDGKTYLAIDELTAKVNTLIDTYTNPTISAKIDYTKLKDKSLENMLNAVGKTVDIDTEDIKFTEANAKLYRIVDIQDKRLKDNVVKPFQDALKKATGLSKENPPESTITDFFEVGKYAFSITTAPKETVKYGGIVNGISALLEEAAEAAEDTRSEMEGVKIKDNKGYIELNLVFGTYQTLVKENTGSTVEQKIQIMPLPAYDAVVAK